MGIEPTTPRLRIGYSANWATSQKIQGNHSKRVCCSSLLSYRSIYFISGPGRIRTCDLPIMSRSNSCSTAPGMRDSKQVAVSNKQWAVWNSLLIIFLINKRVKNRIVFWNWAIHQRWSRNWTHDLSALLRNALTEVSLCYDTFQFLLDTNKWAKNEQWNWWDSNSLPLQFLVRFCQMNYEVSLSYGIIQKV